MSEQPGVANSLLLPNPPPIILKLFCYPVTLVFEAALGYAVFYIYALLKASLFSLSFLVNEFSCLSIAAACTLWIFAAVYASVSGCAINGWKPL